MLRRRVRWRCSGEQWQVIVFVVGRRKENVVSDGEIVLVVVLGELFRVGEQQQVVFARIAAWIVVAGSRGSADGSCALAA